MFQIKNHPKGLRSDLLVMANLGCVYCGGTGLSLSLDSEQVCRCVDRKIFRACLAKFRYCAAGAHLYTAPISLECAGGSGPRGRRAHGNKHTEFMADFCLVAQRTLTDPVEWDLFRFHFLLGADWKLCTRRLNLNRGNFFHSVYRVEQRLGQVFRELRPFPLFPLDQYFAGLALGQKVAPSTPPAPPRGEVVTIGGRKMHKGGPLVPPLAKAA